MSIEDGDGVEIVLLLFNIQRPRIFESSVSDGFDMFCACSEVRNSASFHSYTNVYAGPIEQKR